VIPIRGQILMYRLDKPPVTHVINEGHRYLVPREDGRVLIGSCEEEVGFEKGTTPEMLEPLRRWAEAILPTLVGRAPEKTWSGLRPATFDGFPMIGKVPDVKNLYVAAGHYRSGIHLAPATATVLSDMLTGVTPAVDATPFSVGRMIAV
jgi:glycine oxidase